MPFVLMNTQIRLEVGPTVVGDAESDPELMKQLDAKLGQTLGNSFAEWISPLPPRVVLDRLALLGYRVVGMSGVGQTCCWTLYKEDGPARSLENGHSS